MQTQIQPTIGKADLKTFDRDFLQVLGAVYSGDTFILLFVSKKLNRHRNWNTFTEDILTTAHSPKGDLAHLRHGVEERGRWTHPNWVR